MERKIPALQGILGLAPEEAQVTQVDTLLRIGRWFQPGESACILPDRIAELLDITEQDVGKAHIRLFGKQLTVIGLINSEKMRLFVDLDEEQITPADFQVTEDEFITAMSQTETRERQGLERPEVDTVPFEHLDPDDTLIVSYALLRDVGSPLQSVAVRFHEEVDVEAEIKSFLSRLSVVLFAGIPTADGGIRVAGLQFPRRYLFAGHGQFVHPHSGRRADRAQHHDGIGVRAFPGDWHLFFCGISTCTHRLLIHSRSMCLRCFGNRWRVSFGTKCRQNFTVDGCLTRTYRKLFGTFDSDLLHAGHAGGFALIALSRASGIHDGRARRNAPMEIPRA